MVPDLIKTIIAAGSFMTLNKYQFVIFAAYYKLIRENVRCLNHLIIMIC